MSRSAYILQLVLAAFPGSQTHGFRAALARRFPELDFQERIVPDAYLIDEKAQAVVVFEVEMTHQLTLKKAKAYDALQGELEMQGFDLALVIVDRYGAFVRHEPFSLLYSPAFCSSEMLH